MLKSGLIFTSIMILCATVFAQGPAVTWPSVPVTPPVARIPPVPETPPVPGMESRVPPRDVQRRHLEKAFQRLDRNDNGLISAAEFSEFYNVPSENPVFVRYDRDGNYLIDPDEFFALTENGKPLEPEKWP